VITALLAATTVVFAWLWLDVRSKWRRKRFQFRSPIPLCAVEALDPRFALTAAGPARSTEIVHIAGVEVVGGISDLESWILCNIAKTSRRIFEFGTATGKTTYLLARNSPSDAIVVTITLRPDQQHLVKREKGDDAEFEAQAAWESRYDEVFAYSGSAEEAKIRQQFGDSRTLDETPYLGQMELIFIDGAHTESYVRSDTNKALRMQKPGGWIFWHDYRGRRVPGVWRYLNALSRELPLVRIEKTSLVAYRKPE
jgi:hypothetical protein